MSRGGIVVVGDALLDRDVDGTVERLSPDAPVAVLDERESVSRPGGAALAAALAVDDGGPVTLVTALGGDVAGEEIVRLLSVAGVGVEPMPLDGVTPEKVRLRTGRQPLLRVDRGGRPRPVGPLSAAALEAVAGADVVVVSDYGRGLTSRPELRAALSDRRRPTLWDPHPRGAPPVPHLSVVTPNLAELVHAFPGDLEGNGVGAIAARGERARRSWSVQAVATTLGGGGALLVTGDGAPLAVPAVRAAGGDPCGAGDRFVTSIAQRLADGALVTEAVVDAVATASRFVAAGGAGAHAARRRGRVPPRADTPSRDRRMPAARLAGQVRTAGGTVVVAGGCFDLLHAGHLYLLDAARRLGDCLIVAVNSDASVRRLKGAGRPVIGETDRVALIGALRCVDAVAVFDEDSPIELLRRLRPHVFAKGGDYSAHDLPEGPVLEQWGGAAIVLPYLSGRSTTATLRLANARR